MAYIVTQASQEDRQILTEIGVLLDLAGLTPADGAFIVGDGASFVTETGGTARASLGLGTIATQDAATVAISGGTIDGATIGGVVPGLATFTNVTATINAMIGTNAYANSAGDELVIDKGPGSGNVGASILCEDTTGTARLYFGSRTNSSDARVQYDAATRTVRVRSLGAMTVQIGSDDVAIFETDRSVRPGADNTGALGTGAARWAQAHVVDATFGAGEFAVDGAGMDFGVFSATGATDGKRMYGSVNYALQSSRSGVGTRAHAFFIDASGTAGTITTSGSGATAYNTTSDERLKSAAEDFDAGALLDRIEVCSYIMNGKRQHGVRSAQALHAIFPEAVSPGSGVPGDEDFIPWGVDYSRLAVLALREVKALRARMAGLEDRLKALEARGNQGRRPE